MKAKNTEIKPGDLVKVFTMVSDPRFPENRLGIVLEQGPTRDIYNILFMNGFTTKVFVEHLEVISQD